MSEQEQITQLSALFDGELPQEQAGMVIRRALKDPALRVTWGRYALIGACLRGEPLGAALPQSDLAARVRSRLVAEADYTAIESGTKSAAATGSARRNALLGRGAMGGAIAAGVALVSVFIFRSIAPVAPGQAAPVQVAEAAPEAAPEIVQVAQASMPAAQAVTRDSLPPSYTTPVDNSPRGSPLMNYIALHSEVSAVRFSPMSSVINSGYDPTQGAVEMTAAEVGARR
ncbi:MAG TPA: sigma-E factor negative regulatory protein [Steroidobacteraceae bacterium]|nr:sigma-E factor negative regulatory protein [Steroidobacteraceae bacterium]